MGVRGLTTYIAKYAERYLDPFELHDTYLVIDGDSLSSNLYKWISNCNSAFGGNYDQYFRTVYNFFQMLEQCNVKPFVLLDGGYQPRKLKTVRERLRSKIGAIKYLNPMNCKPMFPLMMREVFVEALEYCKVPVMRCIFEADDEVAVLSRKLDCPVLSYDSDFYIFNVLYIPSVTLTFKVYKRNAPGQEALIKKGKNKKVMVQELLEGDGTVQTKRNQIDNGTISPIKSYYYMDCCLYTIENLIQSKCLKSEMLPLFAVLLGNDYIHRSLFRKFYSNVSMKGAGRNNTQQGKRIVALLRWLQTETLESARDKIIGYVEKDKKDWLLKQMDEAMGGYSREQSQAYVFFGLKDDEVEKQKQYFKNNVYNREKRHSDLKCEESDTESEILSDDDEDDNDNDNVGDMIELNKESDKNDQEIEIEIGQSYENIIEHEAIEGVFDYYAPPEWLKEKILNAKLPRFVVDLLYLKLYVNAPQVEYFALPDCNQIAIPILRLIFTILHYPNRPELRYLTRVTRISNSHYVKFSCLDDNIDFDANRKNNLFTFKIAFKDFPNQQKIFEVINADVPAKYQLYFLVIIYWSKYSKLVNIIHIKSILLCAIALSILDEQLEPIRVRAKFDRRYNLMAAKQKLGKMKKANNVNINPKIEDLIAAINKDECILAQYNLIEYFQLNGKLRDKHTEVTSTILHCFAELQSIVYQLNCLNSLCGEPYENIRISSLFNGCFLFNMFISLKERPNIEYYIKQFIFPDSLNVFQIFASMFDTLEPYLDCAANNKLTSSRRKNRNIRRKKIREARKMQPQDVSKDKQSLDAGENNESDFEDVNNRFSCLLKL